jgi:uncharacterized protein (TIGR00661 family)
MRILYGAFAQGHGHFSKAAVLVPLLERAGHTVRVISSGGLHAPAGYDFRWHRHFPGLAYVVRDGRTRYGETLRTWVRQIPQIFSHLRTIRSIVREFSPEIVISDFEPLTASPVIEAKCEVVALSRQVALFDSKVRLPSGMSRERKLTRAVIRLFTAGADRQYGYHYAPASARCLPPVIRPNLASARPAAGDHLLVYNVYHTVADGSPEALVDWASRRRISVRAYGFPGVERGTRGRVEFKSASRHGMLSDMAGCRGVITGAGLTTAVEAFLLRKPVCVVPIPGQWEQYVNAFHLDLLGIARWCQGWDYDRLLDCPAVTAGHPLLNWLATPAERIVECVLDAKPIAALLDPQSKADMWRAPEIAASALCRIAG